MCKSGIHTCTCAHYVYTCVDTTYTYVSVLKSVYKKFSTFPSGVSMGLTLAIEAFESSSCAQIVVIS